MKNNADYIEMKVPAQPEYVGIIRLTLSGVASRMGYTYDEIEDLKIAVSEACTNAVQHAYKEDKTGEVSIRFGVFEDRLEIIVADEGDSFDFDQKQQDLGPYTPSHTVDQLSEGGLGLYLMETLMDEVRVQNHSGVTVAMTKYLNGERVDHDTTIKNYETN
ncbi:anti-sigma B factor RsbW [Bacillus subtilis]|uniref:Serine-protein kinase RsbW n=1 Tax=Bacillus subtilis TaxID=1423 RepID=A0A8I1WDZ5_BACIU|nr:anti-sigma B factor RsbW [Bacillus subtilis]MBA5716800.1 anti-sigma B factor RsbW [Bacillus subtilis]MBO3794704.1 anti-sigma B factor RsbW [Bacillus subtilis]